MTINLNHSAPKMAGAAPKAKKGLLSDLTWTLDGMSYAHKRYTPRLEKLNKEIAEYAKNTGAEPGPWNKLTLKKKLLNLRKQLTGQFLDYDFTRFSYYDKFKIGKMNIPFKTTFSTTPVGSLILIAYGGLEGARALKAWKRSWVKDSAGNKIKRDLREVRDVLIRDTWAITVYIWGLGIVNNWLIKRGQKASGMKLAPKEGDAYGFAAHEVNRNFMDDKGRIRTRNYVANILHGNGEGMLNAVENNSYFGIPRDIYKRARVASQPVRQKMLLLADKLAEFRNEQKVFYKKALAYVPGVADKDPKFEKLIDTVLKDHGDHASRLLNGTDAKPGLLRQIETLREDLIDDLARENHGVNSKLKARLNKGWKKYSDFLVRAAKGRRTGIDALSFAFILFLIGYMPVKFNEWYTDKEFKSLKEEHRRMQGMFHTVNNTKTRLHPERYA